MVPTTSQAGGGKKSNLKMANRVLPGRLAIRGEQGEIGLNKSGGGLTLGDCLGGIALFLWWLFTLPLRLIFGDGTLTGVSDNIKALVSLLFYALIAAVVLYLIYRVNPRIPGLSHSEDVEAYSSALYDDLIAKMSKLDASIAAGDAAYLVALDPGRGADALSDVTASLKALLAMGADKLKENLDVYFKFAASIKEKNNWLSKLDLKNNAPQFVDPKDGSTVDTSAFEKDVVGPVDRLIAGVGRLSDVLAAAGDPAKHSGVGDVRSSPLLPGGPAGWTAGRCAAATTIQQLRMMFGQYDQLKTMNMTRRPHLPMALWTIYWWPMVKVIFTVRIPLLWKRMPVVYAQILQKAVDWFLALGPQIAQMPCKMAYSDPQQRADKCHSNDNFANSPTTTTVEEGFGFAGIFTAIASIGDFFLNIVEVAIVIGGMFAQFPADPFGTLVGIISLLLGMVIGLLLMLVYMLVLVSGVWFIFMALYGWLYAVAIAAAITVFLVLLAVASSIPYAALWLIDMPTGGAIVRMLRCENSPASWYLRPNYASDNGYSHFLPVCVKPCAARYRPAYGDTCCKALPGHMPDWCPQQQVYRTFLGAAGVNDPGKGPYDLSRFSPPSGFKSLDADKKHGVLMDVYRDKVEWYQDCYSNLHQFDHLNRHICYNVDLIADDQGKPLSAADKTKLMKVCRECYCDYEPADLEKGLHAWSTPNGYQPSADNRVPCGRLRPDETTLPPPPPPPDPGALFKRALNITALVIFVLLALFSLIAALKKSRNVSEAEVGAMAAQMAEEAAADRSLLEDFADAL